MELHSLRIAALPLNERSIVRLLVNPSPEDMASQIKHKGQLWIAEDYFYQLLKNREIRLTLSPFTIAKH